MSESTFLNMAAKSWGLTPIQFDKLPVEEQAEIAYTYHEENLRQAYEVEKMMPKKKGEHGGVKFEGEWGARRKSRLARLVDKLKNKGAGGGKAADQP